MNWTRGTLAALAIGAACPAMLAAQASRSGTPDTPPETVTVAGRVTLAGTSSGGNRLFVFLQGSDGGMRLKGPVSNARLSVGDSARVTGVIEHDRDGTELEVISALRLDVPARSATPLEVALTRDDMTRGAGKLVVTTARVLALNVEYGDEDELVVGDVRESPVPVSVRLRDGGRRVLKVRQYSPGDLIRITGVLTARRSRQGSIDRVELHMRTQADLDAVGMTRRAKTWALLGSVGTLLLVVAVLIARSTMARRQADRALHASHELLRTIFNDANQLIIRVDGDGTVQGLNPLASRTLGCAEGDAVGRASIVDFFSAKGLRTRTEELSVETGAPVDSDLEAILSAARRSGTDLREWEFRRHDGTVFPVLASITTLRSGDGHGSGYAVIASDITVRKQAEDALLAAREASDTANRAKSEFLANMSHELRTPLNSVIGFANIVLKNKERTLNPQDVAYLGRIVANGKHLLGLINGILDLSKIEAGRVELEATSVDVGALVRETVAELEGQTEGREVHLVAEVPEGLSTIETDRAKLKQVLINLIGNALKFTPKGSVTVRVTADAQAGRPACIEVVDTGVGIPANRLESVFEAFQQADSSTARQYGGTGLGLTITRSLAQIMGFDIRVASEVGVGSTFSVMLEPWQDRVATPSSPREVVRRTPTARDGQLLTLVIDDDPDARVVLGHHLRSLGCEVVTAGSADEGIALARKLQPQLITLDVMMPRKNGMEALHELKTDPALKDIPVVVVSVVAHEHRGRVLGAVDCIDKPVTREALAAVLRRNLVFAPSPRVLVVHDSSNGALKKYSELGHATGADMQIIGGLAEAREALASDAIPSLIVLDVAASDGELLPWIVAIREDRRSLHVPVVVVSETSTPAARRARDSGATVVSPSVELITDLSEIIAGCRDRQPLATRGVLQESAP